MSQKPSIILGIDPGASGAIAVWRQGALPRTMPMPKTHVALRDELAKIQFEANGNLVAYLEEVAGNAGGTQTAQQGFSLGRNLGQLEMALICLNISVRKVRPQEWQKAFALGTKKSVLDANQKWKHHLAAKLGELMPTFTCPLYAADSGLILIYGYRKEFQTEGLPR